MIENRRVGLYYAAAALILACLVVWFWPWGALLLWPATSLGIAASAYFGLGPVIFRKADGRLDWSARLILAPFLLGQQLSLLYYRRQCRPWDKVTPEVWIGRALNHGEAAAATRLGVTAVLDLTAEFSEAKPFRALVYRNIPILDLTAPSIDQLREMATFIDHESREGHRLHPLQDRLFPDRRQRQRLTCFRPERSAAFRKPSHCCARSGRPSSCDPKWFRR